MIYLRLFLNFLMIGVLSFGGGYGMVSLVRETVLSNGWLTENEFLNFPISESTPGPLAVNMATFIGSTQGGILGSFVATLGVVLPSFLIILLIASALKNLMKYAPVNAFFIGSSSVRCSDDPCDRASAWRCLRCLASQIYRPDLRPICALSQYLPCSSNASDL